jgi:hypothetical protein
MLLEATATLRANACSAGVAASMQAFRVPEGFRKASTTVRGVRFESKSSVGRWRAWDESDVDRRWRPRAGARCTGERAGGDSFMVVVCVS